MSPEFLRQRRNLIGINAIIILFKVAEISIKELTILGTTFDINKPEVIPYFVWTLWVYFLIRYYQYLRMESSFKIFMDLMDSVNRNLLNYVDLKFKTQPDKDGRYVKRALNNIGLWDWKYARVKHNYNSDAEIPQHLENKVISKLLIFKYVLKKTISMCVHTNYFTEYLLPFFVAFLALIISISN